MYMCIHICTWSEEGTSRVIQPVCIRESLCLYTSFTPSSSLPTSRARVSTRCWERERGRGGREGRREGKREGEKERGRDGGREGGVQNVYAAQPTTEGNPQTHTKSTEPYPGVFLVVNMDGHSEHAALLVEADGEGPGLAPRLIPRLPERLRRVVRQTEMLKGQSRSHIESKV